MYDLARNPKEEAHILGITKKQHIIIKVSTNIKQTRKHMFTFIFKIKSRIS